MKIVHIYNQQRSIGGGEEKVVRQTAAWLSESGIDTDLLLRSSRDVESSFLSNLRLGLSGIYSSEAYRFVSAYLAARRPTVVHAHNLYPQWSPSVLLACKKAGVPVVLTVHCQSLTCPTWYHVYQGRVCEKCQESGEHWCVLRNCRQNYLESTAYALRSFVARRNGWFKDNVSLFIAPSEFMRQRLIAAGYPAHRVRRIRHAVAIPERAADPHVGGYVAFAGRLSPEKGLDILLEAARLHPGIPFRIAGTGPMDAELRRQAPPNVTFLGHLGGDDLTSYYEQARMLLVPSTCYETFSLSAAEGMASGLPVIASRIGGLPELVADRATGRLVEPGDAPELSAAINELWNDPDRCRAMGAAGREWVRTKLGKDLYLSGLLDAYRDVQKLADGISRLGTGSAAYGT